MRLEPKWQALIIVSIGIFMSTLDGSILNIANPTIAANLGVSMQQVQWIVTAYILVITSSLLLFGSLGDKLGSEKIYTGGFLLFGLGSLLCSLSSSLLFLIAFRIVQGVGASMMMATGMGIISNTFPAKERGKALGLTGMIVGLGNMTGPGLGGFIVANYSWSVIFLINVPIGLIGFFLALRLLPPQPRNEELHGHDMPGTLLLAIIVSLFIYAVAGAEKISLWLLFSIPWLIVVFCWIEKRSLQPILDFGLFKIQNFVYGTVMSFGIYFTQMTVLFLLPFYLETIFNLTPSYSGLLMTITPICLAVCAPLAGTLSDKIGSRRILSLALFMAACAYFIFSTLNSQFDLIKLIAGLAMLGIGMGMFGSPNNSSIFASIPREKAGYVGGFISTVRNLSFALGTAGSVSIFYIVLNASQQSMTFSDAYIHASNTVYIIAAVITTAGFIFSLMTRWGGNREIDSQDS